MALAPFVDPGVPVMANYVPVIESGWFLGGLAAFGVACALLVGQALAAPPRLDALDGAATLRFGLYAAAVAAAVAGVAFVWSLATVPRTLDGKTYWEILFWGGGHALQFTWTLLMLVAWLWLAHAAGARVPLSARVTLMLFAIALAAVFVTPYAYLAHHVLTLEHRELHTWGMRVGGGLAILPVALAVAIALAQQRRRGAIADAARPLRAALLSSMTLFAAGGLIGIAIDGSNVRIPAHYHGCIVGVTLALMGLVYHLLPRLGYRAPKGRLAISQPYLYGVGQLMHIVGLVWSGGYGVQRKVAGAEQVLRSPGEVFGMGLMGMGGAVAIAGGLLFVIVVWRAVRAPQAR
jgi:heme/copper-type cytochrome/quinol oxidase subunit 1